MTSNARRDVWLVLPDKLTIRLFFDTGIINGLRERLGHRLVVIFPNGEEARDWEGRLDGASVLYKTDLIPAQVGLAEKVVRRIDRFVDRQAGFYPLAIRFNYRHRFHVDRMALGHGNWMLDSARVGPLPRWESVERAMLRWHFSSHRYVPHALLTRMRRECGALVLANVQPHSAVPFLLAARRLELPVAAFVASWDHTVGKGVITPHADRYVVQNRAMEDDLARYHRIGAERVVVTGWPQTDVYHRPRPRAEYDALIRSLGLDPSLRLVVVMGNTPTNAPYESRFVERVLAWREGEQSRLSLLFRPHPRDRDWEQRFAAAIATSGVAVQEASFTDFEALAALLQHCACVVSNAGTILLDALVNDRPAVCVLYDEGAPPGESWATKNVLGEHYRELLDSDAFYRARDFDEVVAGIERALAHPDELASERARVSREVVGEVDGQAAARVVEAIAETVG